MMKILFLSYCFFDESVKLLVLHSIYNFDRITLLYCIILMKKQIQLSSKSQNKHSFFGHNSDKKLKFQSSTIYSVLTGKKIKTDVQFHDDIKVKRAQSYKKLSFNLRKNQVLLKGIKRIQNCESKEKKQGINELLALKSKKQFCKTKFKLKCLNPSQTANQKLRTRKNLINSQELVGDILLRKSQSPIKKTLNQRAIRIKTDHHEDKDIKLMQNQLIHRQNTQNLQSKIKKANLVTMLVSNEKQESIFTQKQKIPGLTFKPQKSVSKNYCRPMNFKKSSFSDKSLLTEKKRSTYLHQNELLKFDDDNKISELYDMRLQKKLTEPPKQWHFYNCLKLNQLSLYRTNLKLSCQSWVLLDHLQLKYLRGWNPKQVLQFDISKRLFLSYLVLQLKFEYKINLQNVQLRINNKAVKMKLDIPQRVLLDSQFTLRNNALIYLEDLFTGVILTKKQDVFWHMLYGVCTLYRKYNFRAEIQSSEVESQQIYVQDDLQNLKSLNLIYLQKCKQICAKLNLTQTNMKFKIKKHVVIKNDKLAHGIKYENTVFKEGNQFQYLQTCSSCVDISILFMDCLKYPYFQNIIRNTETIVNSPVKLQVGYKFWQSRLHKWKNQYTSFNSKNFGVFEGRNEESKTLSIIAFNSIDKVIIICNDCKLNMCLRDIMGIKNWMHQTFRRFLKPQTTNQIISIQNNQSFV